VLTGLVVHESDWREFLTRLITFRKTLRDVYGLPVRMELHASEYIGGRVLSLRRHERLAILRNCVDELAKMPFVSVTSVVVNKQTKLAPYDVFEKAWKTLFQRFENTLNYGNFPGGHRNDYGLVITDATAGHKLARLVRKMAVFNMVPHDAWAGGGARNVPILKVIEDPFGKDSRQSLPVQMADVAAYFCQQKFAPNSFIRKQGAANYYDRLRPVLNLRASRNNAQGIVVL
jgi:hypothetical protein